MRDAQCFPSETWRRLRPDGPVQHLRAPAPPGACGSLLPTPPPPPTASYLSCKLNILHLFFPFPPPFHPPFISCSLPPSPPPLSLSPFAPMSLALSPTFPPSLCGLLRRHRCRRFISEAQPLTLQAGGAPPLRLSASPPLRLSACPPRPPGPSAPPWRHQTFSFCKGERGVEGRREVGKPQTTHVPQIFNEAAGV